MTIQQLETQLLSLSPPEKAQAINILAHSLNYNWRGITKTINVCGGDACIAGTRIPIWALANALNLGISESQLLYRPQYSVECLENPAFVKGEEAIAGFRLDMPKIW